MLLVLAQRTEQPCARDQSHPEDGSQRERHMLPLWVAPSRKQAAVKWATRAETAGQQSRAGGCQGRQRTDLGGVDGASGQSSQPSHRKASPPQADPKHNTSDVQRLARWHSGVDLAVAGTIPSRPPTVLPLRLNPATGGTVARCVRRQDDQPTH